MDSNRFDTDIHQREVGVLHGGSRGVGAVAIAGPQARVEDGHHRGVHLLQTNGRNEALDLGADFHDGFDSTALSWLMAVAEPLPHKMLKRSG